MKCMYCNGTESRVIDSRQTEDGTAIRRRRECENCGRRFTTYEKVDLIPLMVIKKDRTRQPFDSSKLRRSILRAFEKQPVTLAEIDQLVREIEMRAYNRADQEISSEELGEMVMEGLKSMDEVAYVRFASVYRQFRNIRDFMDELSRMLSDKNAQPPTED